MLIVDDDVLLRNLVKTYAEKEGFSCAEAENADEAIRAAEHQNFNIIVLDVMMPGRDGFEALSEIRGICGTPVIMLTARKDEYDRLHGFDLGADDYVAKPFSPRELMARVKAIMKRSFGVADGVMKFGRIAINAKSRTVTLDDREISLTPKEFDLLLYMAHNNRIVLKREQLLNNVWGFDFYKDARTLDTHIKSLRERLGEARKMIVTVWGVGYKFEYPEKQYAD
jgi:DNA-binding response OmpR family regulator